MLFVLRKESSGVEFIQCFGGSSFGFCYWLLYLCCLLTHDDVRPHVDQSLGRLVAHSGVATGDDHHLFGGPSKITSQGGKVSSTKGGYEERWGNAHSSP